MFSRYNKFDGYNMFYNIDEEIIIDKIDMSGGIISKSELNEHELQLCKNMTTKGLINRIKDKNNIYYMINKGKYHE